MGLFHAGNHPRQRTKSAHFLHLLQLRAEIVHIELALGHLCGHCLGVFGFDTFGGAFHQRYDIAHPENTSGDAAGMKHIKRIKLFAHADELDWLARDGAHRKRRPAARIAIHPGEDDAGKCHLLTE